MAGKRGMKPAGWLLFGLTVAMAAPACATKKDVKALSDEMRLLQAHQDSLFRDVQVQNRLLLDTLRTSFSIQQDAAGQTSHRFQQLEQQLQRTEELMYQMQTLVSDVIDRLDRQEAMVSRLPTYPIPPTGQDSLGAGGATGEALVAGAIAGEAVELYDAGMEKMGQNAPGTARSAFELLVQQFPNHPLASLGQYQIGETYAAEGDNATAIVEFEKVESRWPGTPRAATALLRAGILSEEGGDRDEARRYYEMIERRYPEAEEAVEAKRRLNRQPR